jgi:hypothetical protein
VCDRIVRHLEGPLPGAAPESRRIAADQRSVREERPPGAVEPVRGKEKSAAGWQKVGRIGIGQGLQSSSQAEPGPRIRTD